MTTKIQRHDATIFAAHTNFETVFECYTSLWDYLDPDACIVLNPMFESGLLKFQELFEYVREELKLAEKLLKEGSNSPVTPTGTSTLERATKRLRNDTTKQKSLNTNTRLIVVTSNMREHFFSISGSALTDWRRGRIPSCFETQLFQCVNRESCKTYTEDRR